MAKKDTEDLIDFVKDAIKLREHYVLGTTTLTPINYREEKEKFLQSESYNPQFIYRRGSDKQVQKSLLELNKRLKKLRLPPELAHYFQEYLAHIELAAHTIQAIGTPHFSQYAHVLFPVQKAAIEQALTALPTLTFTGQKQTNLFTADEIREIFETFLKTECEIFDYKVEIDDFNDHTIRVGGRKLIIGRNVKRNSDNVKRLIVHEIESHILQRYNIKRTNNPLLEIAIPNQWLLHSEGLAVFNEIASRTITKKTFDMYYYRLRSVDMLEKSFREIFTYLTDHMSIEKAYATAYRVKRGLSDTSQPGGFPKDAYYLLGYKQVATYMKENGKLEFLYGARTPQLGKLLFQYELCTIYDCKYPRHLQKGTTEAAFTPPASLNFS